MEKETLFIAFSTQKGGAGKTTLTVLVASYLHYVKGMNVAVVDCDYPQHSIAEMRKRDLKTVMEDEHYKRTNCWKRCRKQTSCSSTCRAR